MKEIYIQGLKVKYEDNERAGINYLLYDLDAKEAKVFFNEAKRNKYAEFEDDKEGQFTLSYSSDGNYTLVSRSGNVP
jgi:hypothetical protein